MTSKTVSVAEMKPMTGRALPGSLLQIVTVTKYELLNYFRSRRFFVLLIIGLLISALLTAIIGYYRPPGFLASPLAFYSGWWG
ncbi:MAG TPA: hypothetical protein VE177_04425, partial [Candidatus Binatus sp.]|nr:hypothetical protein [Candidatus Binatus sp.]